jgi:GGDEF domain-containing protein
VLIFAANEAVAFGLACDVLALFESPMLVDGHRIEISARVGISHYVSLADHPVGATIRRATSALLAAKARDRYEAIVFSWRGRDGL